MNVVQQSVDSCISSRVCDVQCMSEWRIYVSGSLTRSVSSWTQSGLAARRGD